MTGQKLTGRHTQNGQKQIGQKQNEGVAGA